MNTPRVRDLLPPALLAALAPLSRSTVQDTAWTPTRRPCQTAVRALLARKVPWPDTSAPLLFRPGDLLAALPGWLEAEIHSLPPLRLAYVLSTLPLTTATALARVAALAGCRLWLADMIPAERNLGLPAALCCRLLPGLHPLGAASARGRQWLARGGLEGCLYQAGLRALSRRTLLGGAALLVSCRPA